jgi:DNA polymerase-3 subunit epsilon
MPPAPTLLDRLAFVDLETTGANPMLDRVTEIGIVSVDDGVASVWSSLVNPGRHIPSFIQRLTGIDDAMVADAPTFAMLADEIAARLHGRVFIAHNARFDHGFLRNEFKRLGRRFQADVACTVKLSRALYPEYHKHNLDSLIERHGLAIGDRHRALADAEAIWRFWRAALAMHGAERLDSALRAQLRRPSLPPGLDPECLDDLPETPGVYLFHDEGDVLLYVGKAANLRQRVLDHFQADKRDSRELRLGQETRRVEWRETVGELGAQLLEARLVKARQPARNRKPRADRELCAWRLVEGAPGDYSPELVGGADLDPGAGHDLFGLYDSARDARQALRKIAEAHGLCPAVLGLDEASAPGRACFARQARQCRGACVGKEAIGLHSARLMSALAKLKLKPWPYAGAIGIVETDPVTGRRDIHVARAWRHLGTVHDMADIAELLADDTGEFDRDIYQLLVKHLGGKVEVVEL